MPGDASAVPTWQLHEATGMTKMAIECLAC